MLRIKQFLIRRYAESDAAAFAAAIRESQAVMGKWMPWAHGDYTEAEALSWFAHCTAEREKGTAYEFGIFHAGSQEFVGGCGLNQLNLMHGFCNLGYWVRASAQRQGAALSAIDGLSRHAFADLGLGRVEIVVAEGNEASMAVAEKAGARRECLARNRLKLHGEFTDAYVYSLVPTDLKEQHG